MAGGNRKSGIHTTKVIDVINNHQFASIRRSDKWQLTGSAEHKLVEEKYETLFEQNPEGGVIIDEKMEVLLANQAAAKMFGFGSVEEVRGANPFDFTPPEERERALRALTKDMFEHNLRQVNEFRLINKAGEEIWISAVGTLIEYQGKPVGLVSFRDITERKRMEEALKESEGKYRSLVNDISLGIFRSTPGLRGRFLEVNPAMEEITGYSRQELLEMDIRKIYVHPEEREALLEELASTTGKVARELRWRKKDGTEIVVLATVVAVRDDAGKILHFDALIEDITDRKRAEEALRKAHDKLEMRVKERTTELTKANKELRIEITDRKRMEEVLRESESRLRGIFDSTTVGMAMVDQNGYVVEVNEADCRFLGYSHDELIGMHFSKFTHPDDLYEDNKLYESLVKGERDGYVIDKRYVTKQRKAVWGRLSISAIRDEEGRLQHTAVVCEDITERKRAELEYKTIIQTTVDGFWLTDMQGQFLDVNDAYCRLVGYSRDELLKMSIPDVEAIEKPEETAARITKIRKVGGDRFETCHRRKDGRIVDVEVSVNYIEVAGGRMFVFVHDITDRRRAEQALRASESRYRLLAENVTDVIWTMDMNLRTTYMSPSVMRLRGYTADEAVTHTLEQVLSPASYEAAMKAFAEEMDAGKTGSRDPGRSRVLELEMIHKDGSAVWTENTISFLQDLEGKVIGIIGVSRNITERKRMDEVLQQSEEKYSTLVERSNDGIAIVQDGLIRFVNPKILEVHGLTAGEILGKPFLDFVSPEYRGLVVDRYKKRMSGEEVPNIYELEILAKDGSKMPLEINASRIEYQGSPADMVIVRDITERKRMEEALKESEGKYRSLVNDISLGIFRSTPGPRGRFLEVNPAMERITGYSREELLQMDVCDLYQHREERQRVLGEIASATAVTTREMRFRKKDGTEIVVSDTKVAVRDDAGQIIYFDGIVEDITERKKVEEQIKRAAEEWRTTFDSITDWVSIVDKDFKLVRVNKAFADAFGKKPGELIGKTCYQVVHKTNEPVRDCPRRKTLQTKRPAAVEFFEPSLEMYLEARTSPIFNDKGEVVACVEVTGDVTERNRMQEQLMLTHRLVSLGELVSGVAHELNNPLTSVIGFSQLLMEGEIADDIRENLSLVYSEAQRAAGIVENLLTFARKHTPAKQLTRINNVIEDVLNLRAYWQRVNNVEVRRQFASDLPEIMVDFVQMQQVFLNIIINAEYSMIQAHNRGTLTITTEKVSDVIRISFADDGPGIAKENLTRIFDPFFTTKEVGVGTGLGLSICHGIVTAHGGRIHARSQLGKGATFIVELPISSP